MEARFHGTMPFHTEFAALIQCPKFHTKPTLIAIECPLGGHTNFDHKRAPMLLLSQCQLEKLLAMLLRCQLERLDVFPIPFALLCFAELSGGTVIFGQH